MKYVCDVHCNECECRSAHETWHDAYSKGCLYCGSKDIGFLKTYGTQKLRTVCQVCDTEYEGATWDEVEKTCCDEDTLPRGEMPPNYLKWYTNLPPELPSIGTVLKNIYRIVVRGEEPL